MKSLVDVTERTFLIRTKFVILDVITIPARKILIDCPVNCIVRDGTV